MTFVMGLASAVCFGVNKILIAFNLGFMPDGGLHSGHRRWYRFDDVLKNIPTTICTALNVPAPDHHQLRRAGRHSLNAE